MGGYVFQCRNTSILGLGHHYDDCGTTRLRMQMASYQFIAGNNLPRDEILEQLENIGLTSMLQKMESTTTNSNQVIG